MKSILATNSFNNNKIIPKHTSSILKNNIQNDIKKISVSALSLQLSTMSSASAASSNDAMGPRNNVPDVSDHFTTIGNNMPVCRLLNGMWQVSGAHGFEPNKDKAVSDMARYAGIP